MCFHVDKTGLFFKLLPDSTLAFKGETCHGGKRAKEGITVLVGGNAYGSEKLPLLVIGKSKNPRCFKSVHSLPVDYTASKKAWMNVELNFCELAAENESTFCPPESGCTVHSGQLSSPSGS